MSRGCGYCDQPGHDVNHCPERLEEYHGRPVDNYDDGNGEDIRCWVQDIDEDWHASMYFEDSRHVAACGEILDTPVADLTEDARRYRDNVTICPDCETALKDDNEPPITEDGREFERASELVTDGGYNPEDLVVLECKSCDYEEVVAYGARTATSCPGCQGNLEIDSTRTAHNCPGTSNINHVIVESGEMCPFCEDVQQRAATDGGLKEVFRREEIVATDDGVAIGEDAIPDGGGSGSRSWTGPGEVHDSEGMRCHDCGCVHDDWTKDSHHTVDDGHNAEIIERLKCGCCGAITEVPR
ncbi:hypothetical protein [Natronobacterium gregoryi]|uniref:CCHC-type domain-containing protein n=2 Tax=Natronobacterium gregoryi TaxID=44930 RepID=L0ANG6_NATGS|nr:hypothetical protein [Natronobacterium gregoryi]AFZ74600.1 hypothetical protein Natgr_3481 [Natronobacterium gregoryi SP2]ELY72577.1 hypothetical protein C490_03273 [Natronobacterium gregoryi SP2]PLK19789.1 hypothetical protein CYV19_12840 [Natronobacterium gregoryi SP2]SFJ30235.1 hypothetical protein SAMN05443661_12118 [Natronobacterium gregoryi]